MNTSKIHPLNVVKDPQKPIQKINLYFEGKDKELNTPIIKQPMVSTV